MSPFDTARLYEFGILVAITLVAGLSVRTRDVLRAQLIRFSTPVRLASLALPLLGLLSVSASSSPVIGTAYLALLSIWLSGAMCVGALAGNARFKAWLWLAFPIAAGTLTVEFLVSGLVAVQLRNPALIQNWWLPYSNPRFVSQALLWCLPPLALLSLKGALASPRLLKPIALVLGCFGWMFLLLAGGRGAPLALAAASALVIVSADRATVRPLIVRMLLQATVGASLYILLVTIVPDSAEPIRRAGLSLRDVLWARAVSMIAAHPLLGEGPGAFARGSTDPLMAAHPHDLPLEIGAEWGLPALLCVLVIWGIALKAVWASIRPRNQQSVRNTSLATYALAISLFAASLLALVDGVLVMPWSRLIGAFAVGLFIAEVGAIDLPLGKPISAGRGQWSLAAFLSIMVLSWIAIAFHVQRFLPCLENQTHEIPDLKPRFWGDGREYDPSKVCHSEAPPN